MTSIQQVNQTKLLIARSQGMSAADCRDQARECESFEAYAAASQWQSVAEFLDGGK